jgi:hypothetical protein
MDVMQVCRLPGGYFKFCRHQSGNIVFKAKTSLGKYRIVPKKCGYSLANTLQIQKGYKFFIVKKVKLYFSKAFGLIDIFLKMGKLKGTVPRKSL